jgi:DNA-binding transcriptional regulator YiaG
MRSTENPRVVELRAIPDPVDRAAACQTFILNGRATLEAVQALRDESIRSARESSPMTVDALAARIGAKRNVVVEALRQR